MDPCGWCAVRLTARFAFGDSCRSPVGQSPLSWRGCLLSRNPCRTRPIRTRADPTGFPRRTTETPRRQPRRLTRVDRDRRRCRAPADRTPCFERLTVCRGVLGPEPGDLPGAGYPKLPECNGRLIASRKPEAPHGRSSRPSYKPDQIGIVGSLLVDCGYRAIRRPETSGRDADEATV